ncbi:uncharacterized protein ChaoS9_290 [Halobacterium phage ChaoS9]|uniref:C2H2-type domain-containing protein n=1 Tax=Halobacterium phage ChaoS9 TaxID=2847105 RepID=A0A481V9H3_9CAUD|nr:uncharacterized protein KMC41_gp59 [Halobacterium phage ChaoS9]QBI90063.1 uncharacterized protein ChaoS9_290 [Halobacterium phage ChaoS9]
MSNAADGAASTATPGVDAGHDVQFDEETETRLDRAVDETDFDGAEDLIREATLRLLDDVLDEDGELECPHDDCDRTFATIRERRGHLGSSEHALDVPEGDFWCGYCGYGRTSWRGINAHHGSSDHDGDPVRLDEEPDREDLIAPDDVPDHKNPELLEELYHRHDGNYSEMCRQHDFEVSPGRVRHYLIEFGIHEVTPQGEAEDGDGPLYRDREWLQERYDAADGNISEMHRRIEEDGELDVPYRTLVKNLKSLGIHDPTESPGRSQAWEQRDEDEKDGADEATETTEAAETTETSETTSTSETEPGQEATPEPDPEPTGEPEPEPHREPEQEDGAEDDVDDEADRVAAVIDVDDPADATEFEDLATPDWLAEASFHVALDMSDDAEEFSGNLGWGDPEDLQLMVEVLDLEHEFAGDPDA